MPPKVRKSININKEHIVCPQCKTSVLESEDALECDKCKKTLHSLCTQLDKVEIEKLLDDSSLAFKCHFCAPVNDNKAEFKTILKEMREMKETMNCMASQYDDILKGVKKNTKNIKSLQNENKHLREDVRKLKTTVAFLNDIRVQNNCIINGIQTDGKEKAIDVVLDIAKKSGADICEDEVEDAYFIHRKHQSNKSSVVVKFNNSRSKSTFMKDKKKLKEMDGMSKVFVNDFLSKESLQVLKHAKSLTSVGFKSVYTYAGKIFAKKDEGSRQIRLRTMEDVDELLMKYAAGVSKRHTVHCGIRTDDVTDYDDDDDDDGAGACFMSPN